MQFPFHLRVNGLTPHLEVDWKHSAYWSAQFLLQRKKKKDGKDKKEMREGHAQSGIPLFQIFSRFHTFELEGV